MKTSSTKNNWEHFSGSDWSSLLQHQPCFADRCDWSKLSVSDWIYVLSYRPELASKFEAVERDWDKDGEFDPLHSEVLAELNRENNADRR